MMKNPNPIQAARIAAVQANKLQRQQTAANRVAARSTRQQARYAKTHPLYNRTTATSITDHTPISATDNSLNQPNQLVTGGGIDGSTVGTNNTGGISLGSGNAAASNDTSSGNFFSQHKVLLIAAAGLVGVVLFLHFRK